MSDAGPALARRVAALVAIACLVGAIVTVGIAVVRGDAWRVPIVLIAEAAAVIGLWYALTRRGVASLAGVLLAAGALVIVFVVVLTADYWGALFVAAIILMFASAASARFALGRQSRPSRPARVPALAGSGPAHPVLIMNPKSGGGKAERFRLVDECVARGIEPIVLRRDDDLTQLATDAIRRGADVIGMAGGDGSQALVAAVAAAHGIPHVCVPAGTRNHFALDLGLDREDVVGALDAFREGVERRVDLARVNGRVFVNNASMGIYAKIVQSPAYREAKLRTAAEMLPDLLGPDARPFHLRFRGPDGAEWPSAHLLLVSNNAYQLDHLAGRGTRERMDQGQLGIAAARINGATEALGFVGLEAAGRIRSFGGWLEWETPRFRVDSDAPIEIGIDGEAMTLDPPLEFESWPAALRVSIPAHAPGLAPAATAVPLTTSTLGQLVLLTAGRQADTPDTR